MSTRTTLVALCLAVIGFVLPANAKRFQNSYVGFDLPSAWQCERDGTEWVCFSKFTKDKKKPAIIILTAKEAGPTDSLKAYEGRLKSPRTVPDAKGKPSRSKVIHVRERQLASWPWVDALHLGSEVSDYYTRYLATVKNGLAILVTFSAHKREYTQYSNDFLSAINSLKVTASKTLLAEKGGNAHVRNSDETLGAPIGATLQDLSANEYPQADSSASGDLLYKLIGVALLFLAIGLYIVLKTGKNKKRPRK